MAWSFIAQRALTKEFLDWDVPLELEGLEWQLSGPGSLKASIAPDVGGLRASDGQLLLEEWGTLLHAEHDGVIRWSGIVISCSFEGEKWNLEAAGLSTYPHAVTYGGDYSQIQVDPAAVFRHIWAHIQSHPDGNLGVQVVGASDTGTRMGTPASSDLGNAIHKAAEEILVRLRDGEPIFPNWTWWGMSGYVELFAPAIHDVYVSEGSPADQIVWLEGYRDLHKPADAEPYELVWSESVNCGEELDELTKLAPLDWVENHYWDDAKEDVLHEVQLHYPRAGRRRDDLVFVQGDNVTNVVAIESNGDDFANEIVGLGAGEGRAMLRRVTAIRDGRLRRVHVVADKAITDAARMDSVIADELNARKAAVRLSSINVMDHPNAPLGSWQLGDDVLVRAEIPWLGEVEVWCRVVGWSLTGEHTAALSLVRSDLYRYGGSLS